VAAIDRGMGLGLYGRPGLTAAGLRGARVAVDVPVSGFALALYTLADSLGVQRADYHLLTQGSTPQRLQALLAGDSDATMLNAGNELVAEAEGCTRLAGVDEVASPYLGTVVAVVGEERLDVANRLSGCLMRVAAAVMDGHLGDEAAASAARRLRLGPELAVRYVERMRDPVHGLVPDGVVDAASLRTLVELRRRYLPMPDPDADGGTDGGDLLDAAFEDPGLVRHATGP
jgi:ABC-type nitrate/sulfonate/bicarbonate transport system substrate-binding protein